MALTKKILLTDNPTAVAGSGNPNGYVREDGKRVIPYLIRAATAAADTLVVPFYVEYVTGLDSGAGESFTLTRNTAFPGSTTVTFTGMGAGPYTDRYIEVVCSN
jgi:hypothetical protein